MYSVIAPVWGQISLPEKESEGDSKQFQPMVPIQEAQVTIVKLVPHDHHIFGP